MLLKFLEHIDSVRFFNARRHLASLAACVGHVKHVREAVQNDLDDLAICALEHGAERLESTELDEFEDLHGRTFKNQVCYRQGGFFLHPEVAIFLNAD